MVKDDRTIPRILYICTCGARCPSMSAFCADYRGSLPILVAVKTLVVFHGAVYTGIGVKVIIVRIVTDTPVKSR